MPMYLISKGLRKAEILKDYRYKSEGDHVLSPQKILEANPHIVFEIPELELNNTEVYMTLSEYKTTRGNVDILMIGTNAEIVIIETKLLRNPESTRKVVAQVIDYIKAFSEESIESLVAKIRGRCPVEAKRINDDINFAALLDQNIRTGNFRVVIIGDYIHPNVLGMIESIHSAPHLSFTLHLVDLCTFQLNENDLVINPRIVTATQEIERSVIKIIIEPKTASYQIETATPTKNGKGTRPVLSWEDYLKSLESLENPEFSEIIDKFKNRWVNDIADSINMGQVGFTAGMTYGGKRIAVQWILNKYISIIRNNDTYPDDLYEQYLNSLRQSAVLYDKYLASGKRDVEFSSIDAETLQLLLDSAYNLARQLKERVDS